LEHRDRMAAYLFGNSLKVKRQMVE
jgi:hypothetical protein